MRATPGQAQPRFYNLGEMQTPAQGAQAERPRVAPALERLLAEHRYEEALDLLRVAQVARPGSAAIRDGVQLLEERLAPRYLDALGDLEAVPRLAVGAETLGTLPPAELSLALKIDGSTSFVGLIERCGPTRFEVARRLASLVARGVIGRSARPIAPVDDERTAQIVLRPDAEALVARARGPARRRPPQPRGHGWLAACAAIWIAGATVAASYLWWDIIQASVLAAANGVLRAP